MASPYEQCPHLSHKVQEPVTVRVVILTVEILLYQIVQSPKPRKLSLQTRPLFQTSMDSSSGNYGFGWWHVHMNMASLLNQPTKLNKSLQLLIFKNL
jgi:hypothetical protein